MSNFILILLCLAAGYLFRSTRKLPHNAPAILNTLIIYFAFPALVLVQVPELLRSGILSGGQAFMPLTMGWFMVAMSALVFVTLGKKFGWEKKTVGTLILTAGFSNTSFVGFPVLEALLGPDSLKVAIIADQAGTFLPLSTIGLGIAAYFSGGTPSLPAMAKRIGYFPPFIALAVSVLMTLLGVALPEPLIEALRRLSLTLVPMALVSVGFQLSLHPEALRGKWAYVTSGLAFKLVVAPLALTLLYIGLFKQSGAVAEVTILESAMAPMITGAIIAADFGLDVEVANLLIGIGIPLSLVSVPIIHWLLGAL